jgi:hypothetical protein
LAFRSEERFWKKRAIAINASVDEIAVHPQDGWSDDAAMIIDVAE